MALKRAGFSQLDSSQKNLFGAGVLGDSLGAFRDGVLGEFTG